MDDLQLRICQAAVTYLLGTNLDDVALEATFDGLRDINKSDIDRFGGNGIMWGT